MRYYIADLHFYHENLNTMMDCRGFADATQMNEAMIAQWNFRVKPKDEVVILGDLSVVGAKETKEILDRLNGRLYMLRGNHDRFLDASDFDDSRFVWVRDYAHMHDNGRSVILCHYPMAAYRSQYRKTKNGDCLTYMLYGHVHDTAEEGLLEEFILRTRATKKPSIPDGTLQGIPCNMINCYCGYSDYIPLTLDEWIDKTEERLKITAEERGVPYLPGGRAYTE